MRLLSVSIQNFRSYKDRADIPIGSLTAITGRNDAGKSTILEALEIFFNNDVVKLDQSDPCVHNEGKVVEIRCVFDECPETLTIDARSQTTLAAECLLNAEGMLEIVKRFDCRTKTPKEEVFAFARYPEAEALSDLLELKNDALKARARDIGVDLNGVDQRSNSALRAAIRNHVGDGNRADRLLPLAVEDGKKVWDQLEKSLPTFALFRADRPSKDDDPEIADPMKVAVASAIREVEADLEDIKRRVQTSVIEVATRTLAMIREMDPTLAQELTPTFKAEPKWDGFKLSLTGDDQIPINKRGSGVRRLILLNFFRAEAERRRQANNTQRVIYAIEEPESSQHPDNQMMLMNALLALSESARTQVLLTTHVPALAGLVPVEAVRFVSKNADGHAEVSAGDDAVLERVAASLGVFPDKRAQLAIYVEGPHDVNFLTYICGTYRQHDQTLVDLSSDHRVAFVPMGGGNLKHWVNARYLRHAGMIEFHLYDCDDQHNPPYGGQVATVNGRGTRDIAALTTRRELENYLHRDCITAEYPEINPPLNFTHWCDVPALVAEAVHNASNPPVPWGQLTPEKQREKSSNAKKRLNKGAAQRMTLAQLQQVDANGEILGWLRDISARVV